jgi:hypothetical protein
LESKSYLTTSTLAFIPDARANRPSHVIKVALSASANATLDRVVSADVFPQRPNAFEETFMRMPLEIEREEIVDGGLDLLLVEDALAREAPVCRTAIACRSHHVAKVGDQQRAVR